MGWGVTTYGQAKALAGAGIAYPSPYPPPSRGGGTVAFGVSQFLSEVRRGRHRNDSMFICGIVKRYSAPDFDLRQLLPERLDAGVGDLRVVEIKHLQVREAREMREAGVGDLRVVEIEML